jgi:Rer1 family
VYFYLPSCCEFSSHKVGISVCLPPFRGQRTDIHGNTVCYSLGIYLLNLFLAFLTPKFDPSLEQELADQESEEGTSGSLPTNQDDEFRPFIRRYFNLPIVFSRSLQGYLNSSSGIRQHELLQSLSYVLGFRSSTFRILPHSKCS